MKFPDRNASTLIGICTHLTLICNRSDYTAPWILTSNITQLYTSLCLSTTANQKCNIWWFLICEYFETQRCLAQFYYSASKNPSVFFQTWYCILVYYGSTLWLYGSLTLSVHNCFFLAKQSGPGQWFIWSLWQPAIQYQYYLDSPSLTLLGG